MRKKEILKEVGRYCRRLREAAGLSQREFANILHCSQSKVSEFECGRLDTLTMYLEYLEFKEG